MKIDFYFKRQLNIINDLGFINKDLKVLDLGCGNGDLVKTYIDNGYTAYGCDIGFKEGRNVEYLKTNKIIHEIDIENYRLPFEDNFFDIIVSHQVLEHVMNYEVTFSELSRVLKPGGISINKFPSRYGIIESHIFVPFGSRFKNYYWILFWTFLGFKKKRQRKMNNITVAKENHKYMISSTNYLKRREIMNFSNKYFTSCQFIEKLYLKHTPALRPLYYLASFLPFIPFIISTFYVRFICLKK